MTDRVHSLTVVLERDNRSDDVQPLIDAILMFQGVASVTAHVSDIVTRMAEQRARDDLRAKLFKALDGE